MQNQAPTNSFPTDLINAVNATYSGRSREGTSEEYKSAIANALGYTAEQLSSIPSDAHLGLGCGNPVARANLTTGENVVDLGAGGGIDVFLAAKEVGKQGQVVGLDMSQDMVNRARKNASLSKLTPPHVSFVHAQLIDPLPINTGTIDCVMSNCVINLLPGKEQKLALWKEVERVLRPGGRIVVSDMIARRPLPPNIKDSLVAYVNCIAGAVVEDEYRDMLEECGFKDIELLNTGRDAVIYSSPQEGQEVSSASSCCTRTTNNSGVGSVSVPDNVKEWTGYVFSYEIKARKPPRSEGETGDKDPRNEDLVLKRWWDAYPTSDTVLKVITSEELAKMMRDPTLERGVEYAVIDVRRDDRVGGHVQGSEQWPAQTFFDDLPTFLERFKNTKKVIFYCGSSSGRGPRCAKWYQDYLDTSSTAHNSSAYILEGGVKEWIRIFENHEELVGGIDHAK